MRALRFDISIPRYLAARSVGKWADWAVFGAPSGLGLVDLPEPVLPGPQWVRLEIISCGVCGTDLSTLRFKTSLSLEPFASFPAVLGHEILARVIETGSEVRAVRVGDRVAVDPSISCEMRGRLREDWCSCCAAGLPSTCAKAGEATPGIARGFVLGSNRDLLGGFSERIVAHQSQLFPVRPEIDDLSVALIEPLSVSVHAALKAQVDPGASVLVIGSGPIAFATIWALRALGHAGPLVAQTKRVNESAMARELGASATAAPGPEARKALFATGASAYKPLVGPEVFGGGGYGVVFDCVGSRASLDQALRYVAPRGRVVLLGCAGQVGPLDLAFVWSREVQVQGYLCYGTETWRGERLHTYEVTQRLLAQGKAPVSKLVTHVFPLKRYREALAAAAHRRDSGAVKVLVVPQERGSLYQSVLASGS